MLTQNLLCSLGSLICKMQLMMTCNESFVMTKHVGKGSLVISLGEDKATEIRFILPDKTTKNGVSNYIIITMTKYNYNHVYNNIGYRQQRTVVLEKWEI